MEYIFLPDVVKNTRHSEEERSSWRFYSNPHLKDPPLLRGSDTGKSVYTLRETEKNTLMEIVQQSQQTVGNCQKKTQGNRKKNYLFVKKLQLKNFKEK